MIALKGKRIMKKTTMQLLLTLNNEQQPKAKYSNNVILQMLECMPSTLDIEVEPTRSGFAFNRGSLVECLIRAVITNDYIQCRANARESDLNSMDFTSEQLALINGIKSKNIEIKFSTSFAPATKKSNKARYTIIACEHGVYMIESKNIVWTKAGKLNINNQNSRDLTPLNELMDLLGY